MSDVGETQARGGNRKQAGALFVGAMLLAGCANRPTTEQLTESIMRTEAADDAITLTEIQADCIADELFDSGLGDLTLAGLAENFETPNVLASDADDVEQAVADAAIVCADS